MDSPSPGLSPAVLGTPLGARDNRLDGDRPGLGQGAPWVWRAAHDQWEAGNLSSARNHPSPDRQGLDI